MYQPLTATPPPRRRRSRIALIAALLASAALIVFGVGFVLGLGRSAVQPTSHVQPAGGSGSAGSGAAPFGLGSGSGGSSSGSGSTGTGGSSRVSSIAAIVRPGLVDINVALGYQGARGAATGIVLTSSGEVLTNNHVVAGATAITATDVGNGRTFKATVVGYDRSHDIAVLQLSGASGLQTVTTGDSSKVAVGDAVVAIGNAGGAGGTPSAAGGSVVALSRHIVAGDMGGGMSEQLNGLIETDADVRPGDSGGPLVNAAAQVIGVDTAASAGFSFRSGTGQGFAVPIDEALAIATQIENHQASATVHIGPTAFLGVSMAPSGSQGGSGGPGFGDQSGSAVSGATVAGVLSGSPAERAGLSPGDVITSVDGQSVDSPSTLSSLLGRYRPGDHVRVVWIDQSGGQHSATVELATGPAA
jgi:S1-C subfamily serine protease